MAIQISTTGAVVAILFACASVRADDLASAGSDTDGPGSEISVLNYNIHGLFPWIAKDSPRDRMPTIGWLAHKYDVVGFTEDFEYHHVIAQQMGDAEGYRGNGIWHDARLIAAKLLLFPVAVFIPHFSPPYGSGVSTFVDTDLEVVEVNREPYRICNGWVGANGDCWAAKGFLHTRIVTASGAEVDVYNTHLEAGPSEKSIEVRRDQLMKLAAAIERLSAERAVIALGDFNVAFIRPGDRAMMMEFRERVGLADSGAAASSPHWRERDYILYRSGAGTKLEVEQAGEALEFVGRGRALSDHAALYARFRVERVPR
jgi:hypothetical protein